MYKRLTRGSTNRALEDTVKKSLPLAALLGATGLIPDADSAPSGETGDFGMKL